MFRLIRLGIAIVVAFTAGILYEQSRARDLCAARAGTWTNHMCIGSDLPS